MNDPIRITTLIHKRDELKQCISKMKILSSIIFRGGDSFTDEMIAAYSCSGQQISKEDIPSSTDVTRCYSHLEDYLKMIESTINNTMVQWPPASS